jgi:hypothetical protein
MERAGSFAVKGIGHWIMNGWTFSCVHAYGNRELFMGQVAKRPSIQSILEAPFTLSCAVPTAVERGVSAVRSLE